RIVIASSNIELSSLYVEMGLGITFATVVKDLSIFKKRGLAVIPLDRYFDPGYIVVVSKKNRVLPSFKNDFLDLLVSSEAPV
ncbi:MAG: type 2 periplasmic-binding domain-containing protein, partial [Desulfocucumaceae bacterium]